MPFMIRHLLNAYGLTVTFLVLVSPASSILGVLILIFLKDLIVVILVLPMVLYCKPRTTTIQPTTLTWVDTNFLWRPTFWLFFGKGSVSAVSHA